MLLFVVITLTAVITSGLDLKSELLDPAWHDVISEGGLHIGSGRTKRFITINNSETNSAHQACKLPNGKTGQCRHLRYCIQEDFKNDFMKYIEYICIIKSSLGTCCPEDAKRGGLQGLAGDLPATAQDEEQDVFLKLIKAETRGCGVSTRRQATNESGSIVNPHEWPWMVSITPPHVNNHCGGSLISDRHVLTAAHCVNKFEPADLVVRLGEYDFTRNDDTRSADFKVETITIHELYESITHRNDIATVKIKKSCVFNTYVWPICLPPSDIELTDKITTLIGWGTQFFGGPTSNVLAEVAIPVWKQEECIDSLVDPVFDENLCAGGRKGGKDACQYDSGGPLMYQVPSGRWTVVGVVSWGMRCGEPNHPGVYTRVDKYLPWIIQNTN